MLFEFCMNYVMFSSRFMLFPTFFENKKKPRFPGFIKTICSHFMFSLCFMLFPTFLGKKIQNIPGDTFAVAGDRAI